MKHEYYFEIVKNFAGNYGLEVSGLRRQAIENLPDSFVILLEPLIDILAKNQPILQGNTPEAVLSIGDMQFAAYCIEGNDQEHACFTLLYFLKEGGSVLKEGNLVVNFTTGEVMNEDRFLEHMDAIDDNANPITYGHLAIEKLKQAWKSCRDEEFNNRFLPPQATTQSKESYCRNAFFAQNTKGLNNTLKQTNCLGV